MNLICPSEKRKFLIREFIDLNLPSLLITSSALSNVLTCSPFKIITPSNLHLLQKELNPTPKNPNQTTIKEKIINLISKLIQSENPTSYTCLILDPEFFYPLSPLFKKRYQKVYSFLKKTKFKNVLAISNSLPKNTFKKFLKSINSKTREVNVIDEINVRVNVLIGNNKIEKLLETLKENSRTLIICKGEKEAIFLEKLLKENNKNVFTLTKNEPDVKKAIVTKLIAEKGILILPKNLKPIAKTTSFSDVIYIKLPTSIEEFLHDSVNITSEKYTLILSQKDEEKTLKRILKKKKLKTTYLSFLNFCGFGGEKTEYIRSYLSSTKTLPKNTCKPETLSKEELIVWETLKGKYFDYETSINLLIGTNEKILYKGFGALRGKPKEHVEKLINTLVEKGFLNLKYFFSSNKLTKKVH